MSLHMPRRTALGSMLGGLSLAAMPVGAQEPTPRPPAPAETLRADVCVIGGGSGGVGAALAAARMGAEVILIERHQMLGGTSTMAWVHSWEPSRGGGGIPKDIWQAMKADPRASESADYGTSQPRQGGTWLCWEPWAFQFAVSGLLERTGKCRVLYGATFHGMRMDGGRVTAVTCDFAGATVVVEAPVFIDGTADGNVCVAAGCEYRLGEDAKADFDEPNAPEQPTPSLNSMTLLYRITNTGSRQEPWLPPGVPAGACSKPAALRTCGNGDVLVNAVNMIPGNAADLAGLSETMQKGVGLVYEHFHWMQTENGYDTWTIAGVAPEIGVRETRRVMGEYVLTEHDCQAGVAGQAHEDMIAITDHAVDIHGPKHKLYEVPNGAYGVPYRCLLPRNTENVLIACRGASFSHIAASSCRLSRTMITLGQAAGVAAAMAVAEKAPLRSVDTKALRAELQAQGVELT